MKFNFAKHISKVFCTSCVYFTISEFALLICANTMLANGDKSDLVSGFLGMTGALSLYAVSLFVALVNMILNIPSLNPIIGRILHFVLCFAGIYTVSAIVSGNNSARFAIIFAVLFSVIYLVFTLLFALCKTIFCRETDEKPYDAVFGEVNSKTQNR